MILYEVPRLYPVIAQYQHARMETKIGDISLPAGVDVVSGGATYRSGCSQEHPDLKKIKKKKKIYI